jgi:hypothetical protein
VAGIRSHRSWSLSSTGFMDIERRAVQAARRERPGIGFGGNNDDTRPIA